MISNPGTRQDRFGSGRHARRVLAALAAIGLIEISWTCAGRGGEAGFASETWFYSTAEAPSDYRGPQPLLLARNDPTSSSTDIERALDRAVVPAAGPPELIPAPAPPPAPAARNEPPRVASTAGRNVPPVASPNAAPAPSAAPVQDDPVSQAKQAIAACRARFIQVRDYTCTFYKRERIDGRLTPTHIMAMKARSHPNSIYFKFTQPNRGREAIYVAGRNGGRVIAHDVGIGKLVAGTMRLDPKGSMAMEDNRHPVTEAGIGSLIDSVARHWAVELTPEESRIVFHPQVRVGNHPCMMIESIHPRKQPNFLFYMVKLYIDHEHGLPIRFEAYDWPKRPGAAPELVEEYTYLNLRVNVGLGDRDFDPANSQYSFGRF